MDEKDIKIKVLREVIDSNSRMINHYRTNDLIKRGNDFDKGYIAALEVSNITLGVEIDYLEGNRDYPF